MSKKKEEYTEFYNFKCHFEDFVDVTQQERERAEKRRDYRDLKQWSSSEVSTLIERGQSPIVFDQFSKKVDALIGVEVQRRTDPKAYPRTPKDEQAAEAITDALRYIEENTFFDDTSTDVFEDKIVEGYGGAIVEYSPDLEEIQINRISWDRLYFDPYSRLKNFKDCKYIGITLWLDKDDAIALNPEKKLEIENLLDSNQYDDTTFEDRPSNWVNYKRERVRVNQEFFLKKNKWHEVFYCGDTIIKEPKLSPYLDDTGVPTCPIELESDFVDRDNNRWGYMERLVDVQDEINHRRSKALFMLSSVSVLAQRGAFMDTPKEELLNELRKGMSYVEYNQSDGNQPVIDRQQELGQAQIAFYQDAQNAMDSVGVNPELTGGTDDAISGRAFIARQEGGMTELRRIMDNHDNWKVRIYRQIAARIKQFWTQEKWVRVTGDKMSTRYIGLNVPITAIEKQLEQRSGMPIDNLRAKTDKNVLNDFINQSIAKNPELGKVVETRNNVADLDVDILIETVPDTVMQQQEQFQTLAQLAGNRIDPQMFNALLKLSSIPNKDEVMAMFEPDSQAKQAQQQAAQQAVQVEMAEKMAEIQGKQADVAKTEAETQKVLSEIPLNQAKTKDELASAIEKVGKTSTMQLQ